MRFRGPKHELSPPRIPGPTSRVTQMLGFGQISLAASQLTLRFLCNSHIRYRSEKFDATRRSSPRPSYGMNMFCRAIRHQQSIFMVEIFPRARRVVDGHLHGGAVVWM